MAKAPVYPFPARNTSYTHDREILYDGGLAHTAPKADSRAMAAQSAPNASDAAAAWMPAANCGPSISVTSATPWR